MIEFINVEEKFKMCTGHYMNYYRDSGYQNSNIDLFIIINEPNGDATEPLDVEKLNKADKICQRYLKLDSFNKEELQKDLEEIFEYGVQIFFM